MAKLNKNNSAVKRIMQEARELSNDPSTDYTAAPLEDDIFEWHCTMRGPAGTEFEGGLYHFRILLPSEYPFRPPSIMMLTPNGRFELNTKICISFTNYHEELWQPAWGVRTAIIGLQGFFPLKGKAAVGVGAVEYPPAERKRLAAVSRDWVCPACKCSNLDCLPDPPANGTGAPVEPAATPAEGTAHIPPPSDVPRPPDASIPQPAELPGAEILQGQPDDATAKIVLPAPPTPAAAAPSIPTPAPTASTSASQDARPVVAVRNTGRRPPLLLDAMIGVMMVLVFALLAKRIL